jgi:hypothetical protein
MGDIRIVPGTIDGLLISVNRFAITAKIGELAKAKKAGYN